MKTILIADDEKDIRMLVYITLEDPGYRIIETSDGKSALDMARKERPDLLVLDRMMPRMNGLEVADALQKDPFTADIPIIMLTAVREAGDIKLTTYRSILLYMLKPFNPLELRENVRAILE
ncbi:MAG: response regulator [Nitrospirae bacterium]|nr:response regulator [Nitrospirota bacterium]